MAPQKRTEIPRKTFQENRRSDLRQVVAPFERKIGSSTNHDNSVFMFNVRKILTGVKTSTKAQLVSLSVEGISASSYNI